MRILIKIWILNICVIDYLFTDAKPFLISFVRVQSIFSALLIQKNQKRHFIIVYKIWKNIIRFVDLMMNLILRHDIIQFKLVYKNDITAFDLWIWGYMKWNGLVSNFVLIKNNLHWTLICCILKRDTCNKFGVKICACRARTKKCDINEKKVFKV